MKKPAQPLIRIVDDDDDLRNALSFLLKAQGWRVAAYSSAKDFLVQDAPSVPGCLILDIRMPDMTGLELQREMSEREYRLPIIFLSAHGSIDTAVNTLHAGAVDFLEKPVSEEKLLKSIGRAIKIDKLKNGASLEPTEIKEKLRTLTPREIEIADLIAKGLLNREVAEITGISIRTVDTHRSRIFHKLGIKDISELIQFADLLPEI